MSWQSYVDDQLIATGKIAKAAILGLQGGVWAASAGYKLSTEEQKAAVAAFNNLDHARGSGIRLAGQKFFVLNAEPGEIQGKKQGDGVIMVKTTQAVLVAEYIAPVQAPEANPIVLKLGDYLRSVGY